jgi:glycosyltransferase involved in cell wall biosynthesis
MHCVGNALAAIDVFMLASPSEGFALTLAEAWLASVPTVATRVGAVPELERQHGQLVFPIRVNATESELAVAVLDALSAENRSVVMRAKQITQAHYTTRAMAARWTNYLCDIANNQ